MTVIRPFIKNVRGGGHLQPTGRGNPLQHTNYGRGQAILAAIRQYEAHRRASNQNDGTQIEEGENNIYENDKNDELTPFEGITSF